MMFTGLVLICILHLTSARPHSSSIQLAKRREAHIRWQLAPPESLVLNTGSKYTIECEAAGTPPPRIYWLKNGHRIDQGDNTIHGNSEIIDNLQSPATLGLSSTKSKLHLGCLTLESSGVYTCVAENNEEKIATETRVKIVVADEQSSNEARCNRGDEEAAIKKPEIIMWTHTRIEKLGSSVVLFCRSDDKSESRLKWFNSENKELNNSNGGEGKYDLLASGDLLISNISWDDMGSYFCVASNNHGQDKVESFLYPTQSDKQ